MISWNDRSKPNQSPLIQFLILEFICIVFMTADHHSNLLKPVRIALSTLAIPVIKMIEWPQTIWQSGEQMLSKQTELINENIELKNSLLDAQLKSQQNNILLAENRRLRNMLNASSILPLKTSVAFVSNIHLNDQRQRIIIDRGAFDGVFIGQAVLSLKGVVGQVNEVNAKNAYVMLITDPSQSVPVENLRTGMRTLAHGNAEKKNMILPEITVSADFQTGDILVTSGFGNIYPKGLKCATINTLEDSDDRAFKQAFATPFSELSQLTEVFLVWPESNDTP